MQIQQLKLEDITINGGTQLRESIHSDTVGEYVRVMEAEPEAFPPVVVFADGGTYWMADGFHRYLARQKLKLQTILAKVLPGTRRDAILYAASANSEHGYPRGLTLTDADKRNAVLRLLEDDQWRVRSVQWLAEQACVSWSFVKKIKDEFDSAAATSRARREEKVVGRDGREVSATQNRPKKNESSGSVDAEREEILAGFVVDDSGPAAEDAANIMAQVAAVLDVDGRVIPEHAMAAFARVPDVKRCSEQIDQVRDRIRALCELPVGRLLRYEEIRLHLKNARDLIVDNLPAHVCPLCNGELADRKCRGCADSGWVSWHVYRRIKLEQERAGS